MESNPLVEETRNQVAIMRGPIVYCLEQEDITPQTDIFDLKLRIGDSFKPVEKQVLGQRIVFLEGKGYTGQTQEWKSLYREVSVNQKDAVPLRLVPYFAWGNRTFGDMSVWLPAIN